MSHIAERESEYTDDREANRINQSTITVQQQTSELSHGSGIFSGIKKLWNRPSEENLDDRKDSLIFPDNEVEQAKESQPAIFQPNFTRGRNDTEKDSFSERFISIGNNQRRRTTAIGN